MERPMNPSHCFVRAALATLVLVIGTLLLGGCGLTPIRTELEVEGSAADLRYILTGDGEPTSSAPIRVKYSTSADKSVGLQIDNAYGEGGLPAEVFIDFTTASDSEIAGAARRHDNDRLQAQTQAIVGAITSAFQLGAQLAAPGLAAPGPVRTSPTPPTAAATLTPERTATPTPVSPPVPPPVTDG